MIRKQYDGKRADVWSCGVLLYVMIVGSYPFEDPKDPGNFRRFVQVRFARPCAIWTGFLGRVGLAALFTMQSVLHINMPTLHLFVWHTVDICGSRSHISSVYGAQAWLLSLIRLAKLCIVRWFAVQLTGSGVASCRHAVHSPYFLWQHTRNF